MTQAEAMRIANAVTFGAGVSLWKPYLVARDDRPHSPGDGPCFDGLMVEICIQVPHRDTGEIIKVYGRHNFSERDIRAMSAKEWVRELLNRFRDIVNHEVMESFRIDGQLVVDPHR